jgi:hypothetical protein
MFINGFAYCVTPHQQQHAVSARAQPSKAAAGLELKAPAIVHSSSLPCTPGLLWHHGFSMQLFSSSLKQ